MTELDFVIIGAGPAGEAAAYEARRRGATVAIVDREWFGGSCPHVGCIPSKSLLDSAARHSANHATWSWRQASDRRDWMVNRPAGAPEPDDASHLEALEAAGAACYRGTGRIVARGEIEVRHDDRAHRLRARHVVVAVGSHSRMPSVPGLGEIPVWTNREATLARELPASLLVLGGGPTGVELAQVYARFGVPVMIVQSGDRLAPTDHPRNSAVIAEALRADGVDVRLGVRVVEAVAGGGDDGAHLVRLSDGTAAQGHAILLAVGREFPLEDLGLECYGLDVSGRMAFPRDGRLRVAEGLWVIGDPAGPELHTHQAHYQGETAIRMALGDPVKPDYGALPRVTYTDPEAAFVGLSLEGARDAGLDAFELVTDFATSARGYGVQAERGHVTIVVDRGSRTLAGAAMACPDASAAIHECVLAVKARIPIDVLAETIHAFPSTARILNGLFAEARRALDGGGAGGGGAGGEAPPEWMAPRRPAGAS
ncbi:MAG TPA: NAD(P)/FAD-dependent oxidoreductase [Candidatus Deferrimicrobiaceae bacterium]|nr:NAD(P)/FAD-dependent oxidoreductase [Candidatus Deferrimicrobiaceae bacterium]